MDDDGPMVQYGSTEFAIGGYFGMRVNVIQLHFQGLHFLQPKVGPSHGVPLLQGRSLISSDGRSRELLPEGLSAPGMKSAVPLRQDDPVAEAMIALQSLGYTPGEAMQALSAVKDKSDQPDELVRLALRGMM